MATKAMMRRRLGLMVGGIVVGLLAGLGVIWASADSESAQRIKAPHSLTSTQRLGSHIVLDPPPPDGEPGISGDQALAVAANELPESAVRASRIDPVFALFTNEAIQDDTGQQLFVRVPAWIVTMSDVCVPVLGPGFNVKGPPPSLPECFGTEWHVIIDATSGSVIQDYSYR